MKILIAPNGFKESLSASQVAEAIYLGFSEQFPDASYTLLPLADGGEGTLHCLCGDDSHHLIFTRVHNANHENISVPYGLLKDTQTVVIESAEALGLTLIEPSTRNAWLASSYGLGQLIIHALDQGYRKFILGLGGTATCDGGMGALSALGARFLNAAQQPVSSGAKGLLELADIDISQLDSRLKETTFTLAHDVSNTWLGEKGALMYVLQKGATETELPDFHKAFQNYADILNNRLGKKLTDIPGTGAAGGMALAFLAFTKTTLEPGGEFILKNVNIQKALAQCDLIITGEGQMDEQSLYGKMPITLGRLAKEQKIPVIAVTGNLGQNYQRVYECGINAVLSISPGPISYESSLKHGRVLLTATANHIARLVRIGNII